ncbi:MAG: PIN domain-containing protein [Actinomycetota bacterium]|nr:PIN domain-containing protein [Actinomycetota bacterium]
MDTNVLIRHLTGDPPEMAARATAALADADELLLTDVVLAECVYGLESFYEVGRDEVAGLMCAAIALPAIKTIDSTTLLRALEVCEVERLDVAEAYPVAQAETTGVSEVMSVDRSIDRLTTITRREP